MPALTTIVTPKQWEVLLLVGLEDRVLVESIHGGRRRITWPVADTPRLYWTLDKMVPRHKIRAIPYRCLQMSLFKAWRHARATNDER